MQLDPAELPGEYVATPTLPIADWTVDDSLAVGIFLARTVPSAATAPSCATCARCRTSAAAKVLDKLLPLRIKGQVSTIPRSEGLFPQGKALTAKQARAPRASARCAFAATLPKPSTAAARAAARKAGSRRGASAGSAARTCSPCARKGRRAILFNGPQLGFSVPELFVELEVHAPGLDVRGVTAPGVPGDRHRPQRRRRVGLHERALATRTTSTPRSSSRASRSSTASRARSARWTAATRSSSYSEPADATCSAADVPGVGHADRAHLPHRPRPGPARATATSPTRAATRSGAASSRRSIGLAEAQRAPRRPRRRRGDAQGHLEREPDGRRLARATSATGTPGSSSMRPASWDQRLPLPGTGEAEWPGLVDRAQDAARHQPEAGLAGQLEQHPVAGLDDAATARRPSASPGSSTASAGSTRLVRGLQRRTRPSRRRRRPSAAPGRSPSSARSPSARLRQAARGRDGPGRGRAATRSSTGTATTTAPTTRARSIRASRRGFIC